MQTEKKYYFTQDENNRLLAIHVETGDSILLPHTERAGNNAIQFAGEGSNTGRLAPVKADKMFISQHKYSEYERYPEEALSRGIDVPSIKKVFAENGCSAEQYLRSGVMLVSPDCKVYTNELGLEKDEYLGEFLP